MLVPVGIIFLWFCEHSIAFPWGAPDTKSTCTYLTPPHGSDQTKNRNSPVVLEISSGTTSYKAGDTVTVTVRGPMSGIVITARRQGFGLSTFGTFTSSSKLKNVCQNSALTHTDDSSKIDVVITWTAPQDAYGDIYFIATVAESQSNWWLNLRSNVITGPPVPPGVTTISPVTDVAPPNSDEKSEESVEEETEDEKSKEDSDNEDKSNETSDKSKDDTSKEYGTNGEVNNEALTGDQSSSAENRKHVSGVILASTIIMILSSILKLMLKLSVP